MGLHVVEELVHALGKVPYDQDGGETKEQMKFRFINNSEENANSGIKNEEQEGSRGGIRGSDCDDDIKQLYFKMGDTKMVYGPEEFYLMPKFDFGSFLAATDDDAIRACLIYGKKQVIVRHKTSFFFAENLDGWNSFAWDSYLWEFTYNASSIFKYSVSGFTAPFRIWIYEMLPSVRGGYKQRYTLDEVLEYNQKIELGLCEQDFRCDKFEGRRPRHSMTPSNGERRSSCYIILGDKTNFRIVYRLVADPKLEQDKVYLNRQRTEVNMEEVNDESIWNNINFDEPTNFQTNYSFDEKASINVGF
uniref:Uncharacterized protein n=1 Tax=Lactuca sativa TaxID=4236 RepID=A0A9R1VJJ9_LACSA|nr:hypothetical protein LSAT_V11C500243800 [Lactuca sativa]